MRDVIEEIWSTIRHNKLRTSLTGFSVAWGIFMLIFLLGAGNGLINGITSNNDQFLNNSMEIGGGMTSQAYKGLKEGRMITLNDKDVSTTKRKYGHYVETVGEEYRESGVTVTNGENYLSTSLLGVYPNESQINKIKMICGRFINDIDQNDKRKVLVVSKDQAKELEPEDFTSLMGKFVKVGNFSFQVIGIYSDDESDMNAGIYTPFSTLRIMYGLGNKTENIVFSFHGLNTQKENKDFEKQYKSSLNANHDVAPDDEDAVWIWNRFTQNLQMNMGMAMVRTALWIVGIFTLLSGIVGVSNIMLISVKERTREFGIRKAIGAKPRSILRLIMIESIIITTFFGYIGMLLGIAANQYMNATIGQQTMDLGFGPKIHTFLNPTVGINVCIEATLLMIIAGTIAGLIPARRAAKVRPIEALRAE
ncbi:MAG TPA: ABC transporter permease [Prevotella sp.]|nr:ABC transporter permease [Prevotella sp.]